MYKEAEKKLIRAGLISDDFIIKIHKLAQETENEKLGHGVDSYGSSDKEEKTPET